ncbi:MAG: prolipoprotein diacylglyceryl transferase [Bryobacteraceae bacterium]
MTFALDRIFDRLVRRELYLGGRRIRAFHACGVLGIAIAFAVCGTLAMRRGLSLAILCVLAGAAVITFFALTMITKIISGYETLIYYHHEIAVFAVCAMLLGLADLPVLPYLDLVAAGLGIFLIFGRVGCLCAGCCHGKPHAWGVRYEGRYVADGLNPRFSQKRLFPVQTLESLSVALLLGLLAVSTNGHGDMFAGYAGGYAAIRFCLEFLRGDEDRRYWLTYSEAQWTSCIAAAGVVAAYTGPAALLLAAAMLSAGACRGRIRQHRRLLAPSHLEELRGAIDIQPQVLRSALGVRLSVGRIVCAEGLVTHYSVSRDGPPLAERDARALCHSVASCYTAGSGRWIRGSMGVFHLLVNEPH